jgi:hypothetical protein
MYRVKVTEGELRENVPVFQIDEKVNPIGQPGLIGVVDYIVVRRDGVHCTISWGNGSYPPACNADRLQKAAPWFQIGDPVKLEEIQPFGEISGDRKKLRGLVVSANPHPNGQSVSVLWKNARTTQDYTAAELAHAED